MVGWSISSADSATLFSGDLATKGATEIGRDRKIAGVVKGVMKDIREALQSSFASVDASGTDLTGALSLAGDVHATLTTDDVLEVHVYTDGVSTTGVAPINDAAITPAKVRELISNWAPIDLSGASVTFYGLGKVGGVAQPPQDYINVIRLYASGLCEATGASCLALSTLPN